MADMARKNDGSAETRLSSGRTDSGSASASRPKTRTSPASGRSSVESIRMSVDLPEPLAPITP